MDKNIAYTYVYTYVQFPLSAKEAPVEMVGPKREVTLWTCRLENRRLFWGEG